MRAQVTNNAAGIGDQRRSRKPQVRREAGGSEPTEYDHAAGRARKGGKTRCEQWFRWLALNGISFAIAVAGTVKK
jgi:hypothetical protein